jgi:hypothetical protein
MISEDCRAYVLKIISMQQLGELCQQTGLSKTALSLYANGKYKSNAGRIEAKISSLAQRSTMSFKDERRLIQIYAILDEADSSESIRAAIACKR